MKRLWIAAAILVLLPLLIFLNALYTNRVTGQMEQVVAAARDHAQQGKLDAARADIVEFDRLWDRRRAVLETFTRHAELDSLSNEASRLMPYLEHTEPDGRPGADYFACCDAVLYQLKHVRDLEKLNWANLL